MSHRNCILKDIGKDENTVFAFEELGQAGHCLSGTKIFFLQQMVMISSRQVLLICIKKSYLAFSLPYDKFKLIGAICVLYCTAIILL